MLQERSQNFLVGGDDEILADWHSSMTRCSAKLNLKCYDLMSVA